jgi:hypothetical protein
MEPRTQTIISVLVDLKNTFLLLLKEQHKHPALLIIYSFIDICASLANQDKHKPGDIFRTYLERFYFKKTSDKPFSPHDLWAARSSLLHSYSPLGNHTKPDRAKPIFYYSWPERRENVEATLRAKKYTDFILLEVEDIEWIAIDAFNHLLCRIEADTTFEKCFLRNAQHFLFDLYFFKLEAERSMLEELAKRTEREG